MTIEHVEELNALVAQIVADGMERGEFAPGDPMQVARAVWAATTRLHHPAHAADWLTEPPEATFEGLWKLLLSGLSAR